MDPVISTYDGMALTKMEAHIDGKKKKRRSVKVNRWFRKRKRKKGKKKKAVKMSVVFIRSQSWGGKKPVYGIAAHVEHKKPPLFFFSSSFASVDADVSKQVCLDCGKEEKCLVFKPLILQEKQCHHKPSRKHKSVYKEKSVAFLLDFSFFSPSSFDIQYHSHVSLR